MLSLFWVRGFIVQVLMSAKGVDDCFQTTKMKAGTEGMGLGKDTGTGHPPVYKKC